MVPGGANPGKDNVGQTASRRDAIESHALGVPFLAADVGGTHARLGLVVADASNRSPVLQAYRKYACADWPDLAAIVKDFLAREESKSVRDCVLAIAGYVIDGRVINQNLAWPVSVPQLRATLPLDEVLLVNDFVALARAVEELDGDAGTMLTDAVFGDAGAPRLVIGPGTGLGAAVLIPQAPRPLVMATEAGQAALAPRTALERDILALLAQGDRHVSTETALSGPGILNLYRALASLRAVTPQHRTPEQVTVAAAAAGDALARETMQVFCALLGSFVGDLTMLYGAGGGVCLAGGVLAHIRGFLPQSGFVERFLDKGGMRAFLERVPVRLIDHGRLGVLGAAGWYLDRAAT